MKGRYFRLGVHVAWGLLLAVAIVFVIGIGLSYDGKCGGFMPGLAAATPCTFWSYMSGYLLLLTLILAANYWPLVVALLLVPPLVGHLLDRRSPP